MLTESDIEVNTSNQQLVEYLSGAIGRLQSGFYANDAATISSDRIDLEQVKTYLERIDSFEEAKATSMFSIRSYTWAQAFIESAKKFALRDWDGKFAHSGITYQFTNSQRNNLFRVTREGINRELSTWLTPVPDATVPQWYKLVQPEMSTSYTGNPDVGILSRALWFARRRELGQAMADWASLVTGYEIDSVVHDVVVRVMSISPSNLASLQLSLANGIEYKPPASELFRLRTELLLEQQARQTSLDQNRKRDASQRFEQFWTSMKQTRQPQDIESATASWATLPLADTGTSSSRTWGIEIETERADDTTRPSGWESEYDGSLMNGGCDTDYCDCDCDSCYEADYSDDHCGDCGSDCHYRCDSSGSSAREFVSPILRSYNSSGLRRICDDLGTSDDETHRAGIHVHVGASDLSVFDVSRLLVAYSAIEHLLEPVYHRKERNYCKSMTTDQLRWWLGELRTWRKTHPDRLPTPSEVLNQSRNAAPDRYVDVNLQSLTKHGTIEFRAMGAWYDYDHLVRWAWLLREIVNVSKLGIDQQQWTACRTIDDAVALLRKYGTEMPSDKLFAEVSPASSEMSGDEE